MKIPDEILQAFTDVNIVINSKGMVLHYKPGQFLPEPIPGIVEGGRLQDVLPVDAIIQLEQAVQAVQQTGQTSAFEYQHALSKQSRWFEARLVPLTDSQFILAARDVTTCRVTEIRLKRQMKRILMMRSIDLAIASGLDLKVLLAMLLDQVVELMEIDAAAILLQNSKTHFLEFSTGKGFRSGSLQYTHLRLGEGCAGQVALDRKMLNVPNLKENQMEFGRSPLFQQEDFVTYYGVPLIAKGHVLGVIEMFHRTALDPDADWLNFLNIIAGQAAIAIDNALMFRDLQRSNVELSLAYDATIEGLSRALDFRDRETQEHTRRVSDATVQLAIQLGMQDTDLVHVRRGAILHDIGKMAIPDSILLKPGPLAEEEWKIMRRHPEIAVDLLSSVAYLSSTLEIPHWHHEKWDGTGYPDGLRGQDIPFPARVFALVDVFDALTSNRPYRGAWPRDTTRQYIESQSGHHFDPDIVPEFLKFIDKNYI